MLVALWGRMARATVAVGAVVLLCAGCGGQGSTGTGNGAPADTGAPSTGASSSASSSAAGGKSSTSAAAVPNEVKNPNGAGGSTSGWSVGQSSWGTLTVEQKNGVPWLHFAGAASSNAWVLYAMPNLSQGSDYTCGFQAMGTGTIYADFWTGHEDVKSKPVDLTSTPVTIQVTATVASNPDQGNGTPQIQVRYDNGPADVYFNEVTCVQGTSVTLVKATAGK